MVEPMVRIRGLYKIFGARGKGVLHHVQIDMKDLVRALVPRASSWASAAR